MELYVIIFLALSASGRCATVGEFPFTANDTQLENITTQAADESAHNLTVEEQINVTTAAPILVERKQGPKVTPQAVPIFKVIRDFLFQARDGLLEPLDQITQTPMDQKTGELIKVIEHGLIEATTVLITQMENTVAPTSPPIAVGQSENFLERTNEVEPETKENISQQKVSRAKGKRQAGFDIANMSTSCSTCYNQLQTCVQKCFTNHNCNDIQRNVRVCPPTPNRLCNPFTPWSPVDECQTIAECKSPMICCNDGCINKCVPGIWQS